MKRIFYLGYYDIHENKNENRNIVLSATNKMSYIISTLDSLGYQVTVVSASTTKNKSKYAKKRIKIGENSELILFKTLPWGNKICRVKSILYSYFQVLKYMLRLSKGEKVIVYHSVAYANIVRFAKKIKKFQLILEVEEIYADVYNSQKIRKKEQKLFDVADAYIFPTELLNEKINIYEKPYVIIYGTYHVEEDKKCKFEDGKIHCVYAGTFDPRKGGVEAAVDSAMALDSKYHIHILGFGNEEQKKYIIDRISKQSKTSDCKVTYDGLLSGDEYIKFIQQCDIGLSTQNPEAKFNDTSFPSKILSYMANGLRVVSVRIPVVECSAIGTNIVYYDNQNASEIAMAIRKASLLKKYDNRELIAHLDNEFKKDIVKVIEP